ncbi:MAG: PTS system mannose/fructose/N-acetylgalactosamine-transporter subunit IIB [bacterium]
MAIETRIDDRLIHGQVIVGWCPSIKPDKLILCDDAVAANEWEAEIYRDAGAGYETAICNVDETAKILLNSDLTDKKIFLIVSSPQVLLKLTDLGLKIDKAVVGGLHYQTGKRKVLDFVYVDDEDLRCFGALHARNVKLQAMDVPTCRPLDLAQKLGLN